MSNNIIDFINLKETSHRQILNAIRIYKEISGAQLSRISKFQPSTIVYILRSLEKAGLIEVSRIGHSTNAGGKPPTLWKLSSNKGYIIGLEITPKETRATLIDFSGEIISQEIKFDYINIGVENIVSDVKHFIDEITTKYKIKHDMIIGVGIAIPGLVDSKNGTVHYSKKLSINNIKLTDQLEQEIKLPVRIVNDANAGVLGIKWYPEEINNIQSNIAYLTINKDSKDIGAGLVINNKLYEGVSGTAGEILNPLPSLSKLLEKGTKQYGADSPLSKKFSLENNIDLAEVVKCAKDNCQISNFILRKISQFITNEIIRLIGFINPNLIVIGGDISKAEFLINDYILPTVKTKIARLFPHGVTLPLIIFSRFGVHSVSVGATAIILREIFHDFNYLSLKENN